VQETGETVLIFVVITRPGLSKPWSVSSRRFSIRPRCNRRSADTLWSSARIGDVGKTKTGYMCLLPLTTKEEDVIAMMSGGPTAFLLRRRKEDVENKAVL
jgi:hypothetical protein